jgi:hypothetical protein
MGLLRYPTPKHERVEFLKDSIEQALYDTQDIVSINAIIEDYQ